MKNRWYLRLATLVAVSCIAMTGASLAAEAGSSGDPLVTLSYLNETFLGQVMTQVDQKIAARNSALGLSGGTESDSVFSVVTLSRGRC